MSDSFPFDQAATATLERILERLTEDGHDFTDYKSGTLRRQVLRCAGGRTQAALSAYEARLAADPIERRRLAESFSIGVTHFFRDRRAFSALASALETTTRRLPDGHTLRVWVPACCTGEEAYSLALMLSGLRTGSGQPLDWKIFATDIDARAIAIARRGRYATEAVRRRVPADILARHFTEVPGGYVIAPAIRARMVFARHDVLSAPPFLNLDLVTCRNLFIYLRPAAQERLLAVFHAALGSEGLLLLGRRESIRTESPLFTPLDGSARLFVRRPARAHPPTGARCTPTLPTLPAAARNRLGLYGAVITALAPNAVVIDETGNCLHFFGEVRSFLGFVRNEPDLRLANLLPEPWRPAYQVALSRARRATVKDGIDSVDLPQITGYGSATGRWQLSIRPLHGEEIGHGWLVSFEAQSVLAKDPAHNSGIEGNIGFESELDDLNRRYQEALAAAATVNDELQATNEEMQAANEELEATSEEMQAANEELESTNTELEIRLNELAVLNAELNEILGSAGQMQIVLDADLRVCRFSPSATRLYALDQNDIGRPLALVQPIEPLPGLDARLRRVLSTGLPLMEEIDAGDRALMLQITPVGKSAATRRLILGATDTTALRSARRAQQIGEERLRESENRFQRIVEAIPVGIAQHDPNGDVRFLNPYFTQLFGYSIEDIPTVEDWYRLAWPDADARARARQQWQEDLRAQRLGLDTPAREQQIRCRDGNLRSVEIALARGGSGPYDGIYAVFSDVTEQREVMQRLEQAMLAAQSAARAKSEFLANMSHEIRTPMNAIIGLSELALHGELPPRQHQYVQRIHQAGVSLLGVVNDILDFSKIEAGKLSIEQAPFSLGRLLRDVLDLVAGNAHTRGLYLYASVDPRVPDALTGDALRLQQVLLNLLGNAVKFTPQGGIVLSIRPGGSPRATTLQREFVFEVTDTGIGIEAEERQRLFQPFEQSDPSTTRRYGGTGLGLTICRRLASLMEGRLDLHSVPGHGSTFRLHVKLGINGSDPAVPAPFVVRVAGGSHRARAALTGALSGAGHAPVAASSPADLVVLLWEPQADLDALLAAATAPRTVVALRRELLPEDVPAALHALSPGWLPLPWLPNELAAALAGSHAAQMSGPARVQPLPAGLRVLLVEDHPVNQMVAEDMLLEAGAEVSLAGDGQEALDLLERLPDDSFDLVLMDVQMPKLDGIEATRRLRQQPRFDRLPIIALTAHALPEESARCRAAGMNDCLNKPIDQQSLIETVRRHALGSGGAPAPLPTGQALIDPGLLPVLRELRRQLHEPTTQIADRARNLLERIDERQLQPKLREALLLTAAFRYVQAARLFDDLLADDKPSGGDSGRAV